MCSFDRLTVIGRPRGEVRQALGHAAFELAALQGGAHWRELAAHAQVGFKLAKSTVRDMARAGDLAPVGRVHTPHARRPMVLFAPGTRLVGAGNAPQRLADVMRGWPAR